MANILLNKNLNFNFITLFLNFDLNFNFIKSFYKYFKIFIKPRIGYISTLSGFIAVMSLLLCVSLKFQDNFRSD